jgi:hypothetical protein
MTKLPLSVQSLVALSSHFALSLVASSARLAVSACPIIYEENCHEDPDYRIGGRLDARDFCGRRRLSINSISAAPA